MNPTPQQAAFTEALLTTQSNIALTAVAGAGKTSTIVYALNQLPPGRPILCCAFNKRIAEELTKRLPSHITAKTMNAIGHGAWMKMMQGRKIVLDADKTWGLMKELEIHFKYPDLRRLVAAAKGTGLVPSGSPMLIGGLVPDDDRQWQALIDHYDLDSGQPGDEAMIEDARKVLRLSNKRSFEGLIDFDDQLYMSVLWKAPFTKYALVVVDEAQDLSPLQQEMLERLGMRVVAVGDPHQAIYGFRGADSAAMPNLISKFKMIQMPLTFSFRCPKVIVKEAHKYVSHIQPVPDAPEGLVRWAGKWRMEEELVPETAVICRNTKPLVSLALKALAKKLPVSILGRDIGKNLIKMVERWKEPQLDQALIKLHAWVQMECVKLRQQDKQGKIELLLDKLDAIEAIAENILDNKTSSFGELVSGLFSDKAGVITLGTVHKMKGFEYKRVIFLDSHLVPSKWARDGWALEQEFNIAYVAVTRAKEELIYADSENIIKENNNG